MTEAPHGLPVSFPSHRQAMSKSEIHGECIWPGCSEQCYQDGSGLQARTYEYCEQHEWGRGISERSGRAAPRSSSGEPIRKQAEDAMILVQCADCEGEVSRRATACPHCGCPVGITNGLEKGFLEGANEPTPDDTSLVDSATDSREPAEHANSDETALRDSFPVTSEEQPSSESSDEPGKSPESEEELVCRVSELEGELERARRQLDLCRQATQLENEQIQTRAQRRVSVAEPAPARGSKTETTTVSGQGGSNRPLAVIVFLVGGALGGSTRSGHWDDYSRGVYYFVLCVAILTCSWGISLWKGSA